MTNIVSATTDEAHHDTESSLTSESAPDVFSVPLTNKDSATAQPDKPDGSVVPYDDRKEPVMMAVTHSGSIVPYDEHAKTVIAKSVMPDGSDAPHDDIIGYGRECIVLRHGTDRALKIPSIQSTRAEDGSWSEPVPHYDSAYYMACEQKAYERLYGVQGIAEYFGLESGGIAMKYYPKGSLEKCLSDSDESTRLKWMVEATKIIRNCHEARVLLFDIAMRNFVVSDDMTLRAIDFAAADVLPYGTDMVTADRDGMTVQVDLFHLGCIIYSLATGTKYQADCWSMASWPIEFPSTENVTAGHVIRGCWEARYSSAQEMLEELEPSLVASPQPIAFAHDALYNAAASITALCTIQ